MGTVETVFGTLLFASCGHAALAGGRTGRAAAAALVGAALLSVPAGQLDRAWGSTHLPVLAVDVGLLLVLVRIALRSRFFWPLWTTAFHGLSVLSHLARLLQPGLRPLVYFEIQSFWSLPALIVMTAGIMLDRHRWDTRDGVEGKARS